jgi:hypothetical protein
MPNGTGESPTGYTWCMGNTLAWLLRLAKGREILESRDYILFVA